MKKVLTNKKHFGLAKLAATLVPHDIPENLMDIISIVYI